MVISELHKTLEKRRNELVALMQASKDNLDLEKQHQIYGAINELHIVLDTLDFYRSKEIMDNENGNSLDISGRESRVLTNVRKDDNNRNIVTSFFGNLKEKIFRNKDK